MVPGVEGTNRDSRVHTAYTGSVLVEHSYWLLYIQTWTPIQATNPVVYMQHMFITLSYTWFVHWRLHCSLSTHPYTSCSLTHTHTRAHLPCSSHVPSSPLHWGYIVLYSTVTARCFFSADVLRGRLDECPLPCWRVVGARVLPPPSGSSLSPLSSREPW